jgi:hypothetical protein
MHIGRSGPSEDQLACAYAGIVVGTAANVAEILDFVAANLK